VTAPKTHLEFRIPISPTESFYSQIRLFHYALQRLGAPYSNARIRVVVGDHCDINSVRKSNPWSENAHILWDKVPDSFFAEFGIWGTANWRFHLPIDDSTIILFVDADTVFLRDVNPLLDKFPLAEPAIRGHMAHMPPPISCVDMPQGDSPEFWPTFLDRYGLNSSEIIYAYSMDSGGLFPPAPAYFNLGFVAMNAKAVSIFHKEIDDCERDLRATTGSHMRCQLAVTIISYRHSMNIQVLPAEYNAANDTYHFEINKLGTDNIRVLHYLRTDEIDRSTILLNENIDSFISRQFENPTNTLLQDIVRDYNKTLPKLVVPSHLVVNSPDVLALGSPAHTGKLLIDHLSARTGKCLADAELLDFGCGSRFTDSIVNLNVPIKSYTGIDTNEELIYFLKKNVFDDKLSYYHFDMYNHTYNKTAPPFTSSSKLHTDLDEKKFDIISMFSVITHQVPEDSRNLFTMLRAYIKPDGFLFFTAQIDGSIDYYEESVPDMPTAFSKYSLELIAKLLRLGGWQVISLQPRRIENLPMMESFVCAPI
jgi:SAM-dependent methyltransferase